MHTLTQLFAYVENYLRNSAEYTYNIYIYTRNQKDMLNPVAQLAPCARNRNNRYQRPAREGYELPHDLRRRGIMPRLD